MFPLIHACVQHAVSWLVAACDCFASNHLQALEHIAGPAPVVASFGLILAAIWLGMSIRQFWQPISMTLAQPTGMAELFTYSIAGLIVGGLLTWVGATRKAMTIQRLGLAVLACVALKVFLWDVRSLDGFWRAISFLG